MSCRYFVSMLPAVLCLAVLTTPIRAAEPSAVSTPAVMSSAIRSEMEQLIGQQEIAGAVTIVVTPDRVLSLETVGAADRERQRPMQPETMFWIASMTKPLTGLAVSKLQEQGKLQLNDPVRKYIPEFKELKGADGNPVDVTILQMLTHTSGLQNVDRQKAKQVKTLQGFVPLIVAMPVKFAPGSKWEYNQSGINMAGRIVEILSGKPFDVYLSEEFLKPLGMTDTTFYPNAEQRSRLARIYRRTEEGTLEAEPEDVLSRYGIDPQRQDRAPLPNSGLFSTAPDYARLCQMLLCDGELDGHRFLKPETVRQFRSLQTGPEIVTGFTPGNGWGVGCCIVRTPQGMNARLSSGTFGHGGAFGTQVWIDPERKLAWVLMVQRSNFKNSDASPARRGLQDALFGRP